MNSKLFNNPVFVKPWGMVVSPEHFDSMLSFYKRESMEFELVLSDDPLSDATIGVRANKNITFGADVIISKEVMEFAEGAEAYNESKYEKAVAMVEMGMFDEDEDEDEEPKKRGRKRKESDDERAEREERERDRLELMEARHEANIEANISFQAVSFDVYSISEQGKVFPLMASKPVEFKINSSKDPKGMEEKINVILGKLNKLILNRSKILTTLRSPDETTILDEGDSSLISSALEDESIKQIDKDGLGRYERAQREKLEEIENSIRSVYSTIEKSIIENMNSNLAETTSREPFSTTAMEVSGEVVSVKTLLDLLTTEVFIDIPVSEKTGQFNIPAVLTKMEESE